MKLLTCLRALHAVSVAPLPIGASPRLRKITAQHMGSSALALFALGAALQTLAAAQSPRTHQDAYALPNAPSASQPKRSGDNIPLCDGTVDDAPCLLDGKLIQHQLSGTFQSDQITVDDIKDKGFFRGHPTRTKLIIAAIGGGVGLTIALVTRHNCPKYINGYRYDGTPPCPGPNYDPGGKSVGLRWRF